MEHKLLVMVSALASIHDMNSVLHIDWVFQIIGILIVTDILVTWFESGIPALLTRGLWSLGWRRDLPGFWPEDIEDPLTWTRESWVVWVVLTFPKMGELLTCPVCLSRHLTWITCFAGWAVLQPSWHNLIGILFWPALATYLHKQWQR